MSSSEEAAETITETLPTHTEKEGMYWSSTHSVFLSYENPHTQIYSVEIFQCFL